MNLLFSSRRSATRRLVWLAAIAGPLAQAAPPASLPPPGQYRIDGEATTRSGAGPASTERIERWDGATGKRTVTTKVGPAGNPPSQQSYSGSGPVTWCVPATFKPPAAADRCKVSSWPGDGAATLQAECKAGRLEERWTRLDDRTWERQMSFTTSAAATGSDPSAAYAFVQRGMSSAQSAEAKAQLATLPGAHATADAMAPVYAQIEETIRTGKPEEAAAARQQLAALKASQGGGASASTTVTTQLKERWTRVADACRAGS